ncbi:SPOR domain-containing protein [Pseudomonas sp. DWP3-1-2]|uniref:SPOR domain-containing protein n=1 Tax=Pseudomonas sp. DWP3-1-2 TaxID=2804645 RepID=UPI003CF0F6D5
MRKMAIMIAVLALTGCDVGKTPTPPKVQAAATEQTSPNTSVQWNIQLNAKEAVSDISAWLLERSYAPFLVTLDGKQQLLLGPYKTREEAEQQLALLQAKITKSHRFAYPVVIERVQ